MRVAFDSAYPYLRFPKRHFRDFKNNFMNHFFCNIYKEKKMEIRHISSLLMNI
jgi:hypothetical protein